MAANTQPIFPIAPNISGGKVITADTSYETPTTNPVTVFTAGENGSRIDAIKVRALGTNIDTVLRLFIYDNVSAYNLVYEIQLAASTAAADNITGTDVDLLRDTGYEAMPVIPYVAAGYKIIATVGTTVATGWMVTVIAGDY
jgi:hypothetical protein